MYIPSHSLSLCLIKYYCSHQNPIHLSRFTPRSLSWFPPARLLSNHYQTCASYCCPFFMEPGSRGQNEDVKEDVSRTTLTDPSTQKALSVTSSRRAPQSLTQTRTDAQKTSLFLDTPYSTDSQRGAVKGTPSYTSSIYFPLRIQNLTRSQLLIESVHQSAKRAPLDQLFYSSPAFPAICQYAHSLSLPALFLAAGILSPSYSFLVLHFFLKPDLNLSSP